MLRASSDTAVAMRLWSIALKPSAIEICRASCRAATMSLSPVTSMTWSPPKSPPASRVRPVIENAQAPLGGEGGAYAFQRQPELDERHRHDRLDPRDNGVGAEQPGRQCDLPQQAGEEGVDRLH